MEGGGTSNSSIKTFVKPFVKKNSIKTNLKDPLLTFCYLRGPSQKISKRKSSSPSPSPFNPTPGVSTPVHLSG